MRAGSMRHEVSFRLTTYTVNAGGTPVEDQVAPWTARAALVEETASEVVGGDGAGAEDMAVLKFHLRFDPAVTDACELTFRGEAFNIKRITPMRNDREMMIEAQKIGGVE